MLLKPLLDFLGGTLFTNIILLSSALIALAIGWQQLWMNDVVEVYVTAGTITNVDGHTGQAISTIPALLIQNVGTRLIYLDKYNFNGREYLLNGQVLPSTYSQANNPYYSIELPTNGETHVSLDVYYHDVGQRHWKSHITADLQNGRWVITPLERTPNQAVNS